MQDLINKLLEIIPSQYLDIQHRNPEDYMFKWHAVAPRYEGMGNTPEEALQDLLNQLTKKI